MNQPDPGRIEKILGNFRPKRKPAFEALLPWKSLIQGLRAKCASYDDIAEILNQEGVQTSDTTVRKFCHKVLMESQFGKSRRRRRLTPETGYSASAQQHGTTGDGRPTAEALVQHKPPIPVPRTPGPRIAVRSDEVCIKCSTHLGAMWLGLLRLCLSHRTDRSRGHHQRRCDHERDCCSDYLLHRIYSSWFWDRWGPVG